MIKKTTLSSMTIAITLLLVLVTGVKTANAAITSQLRLGSRGDSVTQLQQFLRADTGVYPAGIVSGYFGSMTRVAIRQLQIAYGLVADGIVGPRTMAKINGAMSASVGLDLNAPVISNPSVQIANTTAMVNFNTNEAVTAQVYYDTVPLRLEEESVYGQFPYVSGTLASYTSSLSTSHMISMPNLQSNTTYYYIIRTMDASGNMSMTWPTTLRTN